MCDRWGTKQFVCSRLWVMCGEPSSGAMSAPRFAQEVFTQEHTLILRVALGSKAVQFLPQNVCMWLQQRVLGALP